MVREPRWADHRRMMTCGLCGGTITTCASCRGTCADPVCHACRDSDLALSHAGPDSNVTVTLSSPVVLV